MICFVSPLLPILVVAPLTERIFVPSEMLQLESDLAYLSSLQSQIIESVLDWRTGRLWYKEKRSLTGDELKQLIRIATEHELVCEIRCNGFGPMVVVYAHPVVPGIPLSEPLIAIAYDQLPNADCLYGDAAWRNGWKIFSPLTHNKRNRELLALYGRKELEKYPEYIY